VPLLSGHGPASAEDRGSHGAAPANASGSSAQREKMNSSGSKFELSRAQEFAWSGTGTLVCGPATSASQGTTASSLRGVAYKPKIKRDTVLLSLAVKSLRGKKVTPEQVGHFLTLTASRSPRATAHFYSTMKMNRNRYISMKTNVRCHFYSTIIPGGRRRLCETEPSGYNGKSSIESPESKSFQPRRIP
jgi:hypothetical protein